MIISGMYDYANGKNQIVDFDGYSFSKSGTDYYVLCNSLTNPSEDIMESFDNHGIQSVNHINDAFLFTKSTKDSLLIFSDLMNALWTLYYVEANDKFYYSTSLKRLLAMSLIPRQIDLYSARVFLQKGFLPNKSTLLKFVCKLSFGDHIIVDKKGFKVIPYSDNEVFYIFDSEKNNANLINRIQDEVLRYAELMKDVYMPLSGGYDSNLVLHTIYQHCSSKIHTFIIGGIRGTNEIPAAERNLKQFDGVVHHSKTIDESAINYYPDIIWRLDGLLYERGIFLQYALAHLAMENNADYMICGEYADQILHQYYMQDMKYAIRHKYPDNCIFRGNETPFLFGSCVITKKSFLLLQSFNIVGCYPFINREIAKIANLSAVQNGVRKKAYKTWCKEIFDKHIVNNISKIGGSTDTNAILTEEILAEIRQIAEDSELIKKVRNMPYHVDSKFFNEYVHYQYLNEGELPFIRALKACQSLMYRSLMTAVYGHLPNSEDIAINSVDLELKELYLIVFDKLFVSGDFDAYFSDNACPSDLHGLSLKK